MSSTSLCDGLPHFSVAGSGAFQKSDGLEKVVDNAFIYRVKCHDVLTAATRAFAEVIGDEGQADSSLLPLIKIFNDQAEAIPLPPADDICMFPLALTSTVV